MHKFAAIGIISVFIAGCGESPAWRSQTIRFEAAFAKAVPLCEKLFLPNAQATEPRIDLEKSLYETRERIKTLSDTFRSEHGEEFLLAKIDEEKDHLAKACAEKLLVISPE